MQDDKNGLRSQPSIELPHAKKSRVGEFISGNNRFGSKGTIRCRKCQQRKGKCVFENASTPCDYCFARGLECGPKLPTPRKLAEGGYFALMAGGQLPMAIAQPATTSSMAGQLHVQIPVTLSQMHDGSLSLTSANSDKDIPPFAFQSPRTPPQSAAGYRPYSSTAGFASLMSPLSLGIAVPCSDGDIVRTWSQQPSPPRPEPIPSPQLSPRTSFCPAIPPRHPAHTLNTYVLPIISSAIPNMPTPPESDTMFSDEEDEQLWEAFRQWIDFEGSRPGERRLLLKFNRALYKPRNKIGRKLAGKWDEESKIKKEDESVKSIKTAPSIIC